MLSKPRNLLWILPLAIILSSPLWQSYVAEFLTPRGGYDAKVAAAYKRQSQNFIMDQVSITLSTNGEVTWRINAERAHTGKTDRDIGMIEVDAHYTAKGKAPIHITSNKGWYQMDNQHLTLLENVIVRKPEQNEALFTDILHYYDATKMLVSPVNVDIQGPKFEVEAGRMDYDLATEAYDFSKRVKVTL